MGLLSELFSPKAHAYKFSAPTQYGYGTPFGADSINNSTLLQQYGTPVTKEALTSLLQMIQGQGRVDPRLLAQAQTANSRSTMQQQDAARANATRSGFGNAGVSQAIQAAIASAGANRAANLNYQDIADSYARQQQNLGLYNQLVQQPQLGYGAIGSDVYGHWSGADEQHKAAKLGVMSSVMGSLGKMFGGGFGGG